MRLRSILLATAFGLGADAVWRRTRAARLRPLPSSGGPVADEHCFVTAAGVVLDEETRRAASTYATGQRLDVLDLVPAGLDCARALELARRVEPDTYRAARLARGVGGGHAMLVTADVAERAKITRFAGLDAAEMEELAVRLKTYAPVGTDLAVAGRIAPVGCSAAERRTILRGRWPSDLPEYLSGNLLGLAVLSTGVAWALASRRKGDAAAAAAVLVATCAQPVLATAGTPLRPHDLAGFSLLRPVTALVRWVRVAAQREEPDPEMPRLRRQYAAELAEKADTFVEPRRTDCPWCGGTDLRRLVTSGDHQHHRPGVFILDKCRDCGHVFQNPRLSSAGLEFHYRDFYDGPGGPEVERGFRLAAPHYRDRARMVRGHTEPEAWLDVGGGHGHFCNAARDVWPQTRFDALDMSVSIKEAEERGWIDGGHLGFFPDLADKLAGAYDVVSMHHYLEHTVDPYAELDAAATVLAPGGHLLIEVPDPEWIVGRVAGRWWHAWFQPQHLNFVPLGNLVDALADRGLETVAVERGPAHQPVDFLMIVMMLAHRLVPDPAKPWRTERHPRLRRALRAGVYLAAGPAMFVGASADQLLAPLIKRGPRSNTYRVLARRVPAEGDQDATASALRAG
ncbi:methyltransferase domain-containing protein [Spirillospora sp. NPDC048911]|uniref:class I SAM-dependent methyltransferase n=1 Tax=Spirillospora sp. NPDC048911 TaxID=3364527 RepID=UPI00371CBBBA